MAKVCVARTTLHVGLGYWARELALALWLGMVFVGAEVENGGCRRGSPVQLLRRHCRWLAGCCIDSMTMSFVTPPCCTGRRTKGCAVLCYLGLSLDSGHASTDSDVCGPSLSRGAVAKRGLRRGGEHVWLVCVDEGAAGVVGTLGRGVLGLGSLVLSALTSQIYTLQGGSSSPGLLPRHRTSPPKSGGLLLCVLHAGVRAHCGTRPRDDMMGRVRRRQCTDNGGRPGRLIVRPRARECAIVAGTPIVWP